MVKSDVRVMFHDKLNYKWHEIECFNFCKCNMTQKNMKICMCDHKPKICLWLKSHVILMTVSIVMDF